MIQDNQKRNICNTRNTIIEKFKPVVKPFCCTPSDRAWPAGSFLLRRRLVQYESHSRPFCASIGSCGWFVVASSFRTQQVYWSWLSRVQFHTFNGGCWCFIMATSSRIQQVFFFGVNWSWLSQVQFRIFQRRRLMFYYCEVFSDPAGFPSRSFDIPSILFLSC